MQIRDSGGVHRGKGRWFWAVRNPGNGQQPGKLCSAPQPLGSPAACFGKLADLLRSYRRSVACGAKRDVGLWGSSSSLHTDAPHVGVHFPRLFLSFEHRGAQAGPSQCHQAFWQREQERSLVTGQHEFGSRSSLGALCEFC